MKHVGQFEGEAVAVLGYNPAMNKILSVQPKRLGEDDLNYLVSLVNSNEAQSVNNLYAVASKIPYKGTTAWEYFVRYGLELPAHVVRLADEEQSIAWMKTTSSYWSDLDLGVFAPSYSKEDIPSAVIPDVDDVQRLISSPAFTQPPSTNPLPEKTPLEIVTERIDSLESTVTKLASLVESVLTQKPEPVKKERKPRAAAPTKRTRKPKSEAKE